MCLFGASWLCSQCGKDFCSQCHAELAELKVLPYKILLSLPRTNPRTQGDALCPSLTSCVSSEGHESALFIPTSRYTEDDILLIMNAMKEMSNLAAPRILHPQTTYYKLAMIAEAELKSSILRIPVGELKAVEFRRFLAKRIPLVITDLNRKLQLSWSPSHLIKEYGTDVCSLQDCEEEERPVKRRLKTFLSRFMDSMQGVSSGNAEEPLPYAIWRIKVRIWPSELNVWSERFLVGLATHSKTR
jgi:lysine-specific demethylase 3